MRTRIIEVVLKLAGRRRTIVDGLDFPTRVCAALLASTHVSVLYDGLSLPTSGGTVFFARKLQTLIHNIPLPKATQRQHLRDHLSRVHHRLPRYFLRAGFQCKQRTMKVYLILERRYPVDNIRRKLNGSSFVACVCRCRGGQWEKAVGILRDVQNNSGGVEVDRSEGGDRSSGGGGSGVWTYFGQASSLAFNAALVACAKVRRKPVKGNRELPCVGTAWVKIPPAVERRESSGFFL